LLGQIERFDFEYPYLGFSTNIRFDEDGFLWFPNYEETDYFRYNGQDVQALGLPEILNSLTEEYIIEEPFFTDGKLLINSRKKLAMVDIFNKDVYEFWTVPDGHHIDIVYEDESGGLWMFTKDNTKNSRPVYNIEQGGKIKYAYDLYPYFGEELIDWWPVLNDANGLLYFHGSYGGLLILNQEGEEQNLYLRDQEDFDQKYACSVFRLDNKNNLWRFYRKEVEVYNKQEGVFVKHPLSGNVETSSDCPDNYKNGLRTIVIWEDQKGRQWFGGEDSFLYLFDPKKGEALSFGQRLVADIGGRGGGINNLLEDKGGNIYGTKRGGVFKISEKETYFEPYLVDTDNEKHSLYGLESFKNLNLNDPELGTEFISNTNVSSLSENEKGLIFFNDYRFLFALNPDSEEFEIIPFDPVDKSKTRTFAYKDKVLLSLWTNVFLFDDKYNYTKIPNSEYRLVNTLFQNNGKIWYSGSEKKKGGTNENQPFLARADSSLNITDQFIDPEGAVNFNDLKIHSIVEDDDSNVWLGTADGIYKISSDNEKVDFIADRYSWNEEDISITHQLGLYINWIGGNKLGFHNRTGIGVIDVGSNKLLEYVSNEELNIAELMSGHTTEKAAWIGSQNKLIHVDFASNKIIQFSEAEGLTAPCAIKIIQPLSDDKIALATSNGLYLFKPDTLLLKHERKTSDYERNRLKLTSASFMEGASDSISTRKFFEDDEHSLIFGHQDRMLNFEFSLMDFSSPRQHLFSYWLEGFNKEWSRAVESNSVSFTHLPPGKYKLKVRAHSGNGVWGEEHLNVDIFVKTAWYKTWWFLLFCLLVLAALVYGLIKHLVFLAKSKFENEAQKKEAERLKELDDSKNLFFANITHEFRTPLTVINGVNESSNASSDEKTLIRRNSNNLLHLITQLLDLTKLESKKLTLQLTTSNLIEYLRYLTASFDSMASSKEIVLRFEPYTDELVMNYDEMRIQQIMYNLISNAMKFTQKGGSITVSINKVMKDRELLQISISDSGIGIPEEDIPHLFDHFYQVSNPITRIGEGTGVGLSLTHELVQLMGGEIKIESVVGQGSEFTVILPIDDSPVEKPVPSNYNPLDPETILLPTAAKSTETDPLGIHENQITADSRPILLLIEDNADIVTYICSILSQSYQIVISINGELGIAKAIEIVPDIIISDVMMPIKDGYEVCRTLKQHETTDHIPIILLTAKSEVEDRIQGLKYGADAYINKPFVKEELTVRLEQLLLIRKNIQEKYNQQITAPQVSRTDEKDAFFHKLKDVVTANLSDHLFGVPEMAKALLMSQPQVYRKSKALLDKTPTALLNMMRLNMAKELLKNTTHSISQVATLSGYKDANYFSRVFQSEFRLSPSSFRNRHTDS